MHRYLLAWRTTEPVRVARPEQWTVTISGRWRHRLLRQIAKNLANAGYQLADRSAGRKLAGATRVEPTVGEQFGWLLRKERFVRACFVTNEPGSGAPKAASAPRPAQ